MGQVGVLWSGEEDAWDQEQETSLAWWAGCRTRLGHEGLAKHLSEKLDFYPLGDTEPKVSCLPFYFCPFDAFLRPFL